MARAAKVVEDTPVDLEVETVATPEPSLADEAQRLLEGGEEAEYTLVPAAVAAQNQTVEMTDILVTDAKGDQYSLCRKKA